MLACAAAIERRRAEVKLRHDTPLVGARLRVGSLADQPVQVETVQRVDFAPLRKRGWPFGLVVAHRGAAKQSLVNFSSQGTADSRQRRRPGQVSATADIRQRNLTDRSQSEVCAGPKATSNYSCSLAAPLRRPSAACIRARRSSRWFQPRVLQPSRVHQGAQRP